MRRSVILCAAVLSAGCLRAPGELTHAGDESGDGGAAELAGQTDPADAGLRDAADAGPSEMVDGGPAAAHLPKLVQPTTYSQLVSRSEGCQTGNTDGTGTLLTGVGNSDSLDASFWFTLPDGGVPTGFPAVYAVSLPNGFFCYSHSAEGTGSYQLWMDGTFSGAVGIRGYIHAAAADSTCLRVREDLAEDGGWVNRLRCLREDPTLGTAWSVPEPETAESFTLDSDGCSLLYGFEPLDTGSMSIVPSSWVNALGRTTASFQGSSVPVGNNGGGYIVAALGLVGGAGVRTVWTDGGAEWTAWLPHGSSDIEPAPSWLAERPNTDIAVIEGGNAYAVLPWPTAGSTPLTRTISILDTSGGTLGELTLDVPAESANGHFTVGYDGSLILSWSTPLLGDSPHVCGWTVWPQMLR